MPTNDCYIQFTDEEMIELGFKPGEKFSVHHNDDGSILMEKFASIEIDFGAFDEKSRMALYENLITQSCEKDISTNEVISDMLRSFIEDNDGSESCSNPDCCKGILPESLDETEGQEWEDGILPESLDETEGQEWGDGILPESSDETEGQEWGDGIAFLPMNMFQRIENILEYNESLKDEEGNPPEIGDLTFALRQDGVDVTAPQVEAILQLEEDTIVKKIAWRS